MIARLLPLRRISLVLALVVVSVAVHGQESPKDAPAVAKSGKAASRGEGNAPPAQVVSEAHKLPPDSTTKHTLDLAGRSLAFTATAGSIRLFNEKG